MTIRWIGQSGYILKSKASEIIIDPYLSDAASHQRLVPPLISPEEIAADAVICTHNHIDHLDLDAAAQMDESTHFVTTAQGKAELRKLNRRNVTAFSAGDEITVGNFEIAAVFANHSIPAFGLIIKAEGICCYFSGDTLFDEGLFAAAEYKPDITFICINGKLGNMNVDEAVSTAKKIGARVNIPNHYGMFASNTENPERFTTRVSGGFTMELGQIYNAQQIIESI